MKNEKGMSIIVKTVTRLTLGFILLYGVYIALNGHVAPGGGFAGGVIIALAFVHIMLAFGKETALYRLRARTLRIVISVAAVLFLAAVAVPFFGADVPFDLMPLCEMIVIGGGLFAIFVALVLLSKTDRDAE